MADDEIDWLASSATWHTFHFGVAPRNRSDFGSDLAAARRKAHLAFDPIWKMRIMSRTAAYRWLAKKMPLPADNCHIGMFNAGQCQRVVEVCDEYFAERALSAKHGRRSK